MTTNSGYTTGDTPIGSSVGSDLGVRGTTETGPSTTDTFQWRASRAPSTANRRRRCLTDESQV